MNAAGPDRIFAFFFRPQGRIGRAEYALGLAFIWACVLAILAFTIARTEEPAALAFAMFLSLPFTVAYLVLVAKRCHDVGLPGTFLLLLFVPFVGILWLAALCFIPGTAGPNPYGAAPTDRSD